MTVLGVLSNLKSNPLFRFSSPAIIKILRGVNFSQESSTGLEDSLRTLFDERTAQFQIFNEKTLNFKEIESPIPINTLLVFPGAPSISKWSFSQETQRKIQCYYECGLLKVIGVCAGAFFCSRHVIYQEKEGTKSLIDIFKGACVGPAYEGNVPAYGKVNIRVESIRLIDSGMSCYVAMNGGGYFDLSTLPVNGNSKIDEKESTLEEELEKNEESSLVEVRAEYEHNNQPAVIACRPSASQGAGAVFLGPHFEYHSRCGAFKTFGDVFPDSKKDLERMQAKLDISEKIRQEAFADYIEELGFS